MNVVFTIVAKNYMASAITLMKSVEKYDSHAKCYIILADRWTDEIQREKIPFDVLTCDSLGIEELDAMAFMYDVVEFSTAIKPFAFLHFIEHYKADKLIYLDPDILVMDSLDDIWGVLDTHSCALTPHIVDMRIDSGKSVESHVANRGAFNFGFLAINRNADIVQFLKWWSKQLITDCIRSDTLFVDQKWSVFIPCFIDDYYVIKSKAYNIADWNLHERVVSERNEAFEVDDFGKSKKIVFFHFSGIKQQSPQVFFEAIQFNGGEREKDALSKLISKYETELANNGFDYWSKCPYSFNYFENGLSISLYQRRLFRALYLDNNRDLGNPFSINSKYYSWLEDNNIPIIKLKEEFVGNNSVSKSIGKKSRSNQFIKKVVKRYIRRRGTYSFAKDLDKIRSLTDVNNQLFWFK